MADTESFAPTVNVDGKTVTPAGWMWQWAFAINGCDWAIKIVSTEEWKNTVRLWYAEREAYYAANAMTEQQERLDKARAEMEKAQVEVERMKKEFRL